MDNEELPQGYDKMMEFLDAEDYNKKLDILERMRYNDVVDTVVLNNMAASIDVVLADGDVEDMLRQLIDCVRTRARY